MIIRLGNHHIWQMPEGAAVTIGNFDGVHLGHRHIISRLTQEAQCRGLKAIMLVFEPMPQEFFSEKTAREAPYRLSPLRDKIRLLRHSQALDGIWVLRFNASLANLSANDFIDRILIQALNTRYLLIGDDFRFGKGRQGDLTLLQAQRYFVTERTDSIIVRNIRASSTAVRQALLQGNIDEATELLGHSYTLSGHVKHGAKLGRELGCPTANIHLPPHRYPLSGVYIVSASGAFGQRYGVASFGLNPTVSNSRAQKLEVHLFQFQGDLYGERLEITFLHKLRDEAKFDSLATLQAAIWQDMSNAKTWLINSDAI